MKLYSRVLEWTLHITICLALWFLYFKDASPLTASVGYLLACFVSAVTADVFARWATGHEHTLLLCPIHRVYAKHYHQGEYVDVVIERPLRMSPKKFGALIERQLDPNEKCHIYRIETCGVQIFGIRFIWNSKETHFQ